MRKNLKLLLMVTLTIICAIALAACGKEGEQYPEEEQHTEGLTYTLIDRDTAYSVSAGYESTNLENLIIPSMYNDLPVTQIAEEGFSRESNLRLVKIPKSITYIGGGAFAFCESLKVVEFAEGSELQDMWYTIFLNCISLETIELPPGITHLKSRVFEGCTNLKTVTGKSNSELISIEDSVFEGCTSLISVYAPRLLSIGNSTFRNCTSLQALEIKKDSRLFSIGNDAFSGCTKLSSFFIPKTVTWMGQDVFDRCTGLTEINVDSENTSYKSIEGVLFSNNFVLIKYPAANPRTTYTIPSGVGNIGWNAFEDSKNLTEIVIPQSVKTINSFAFRGCTNVLSITIPSSVTELRYAAFYGWTDKQTIYFQVDKATAERTLGNTWKIDIVAVVVFNDEIH